MFQLKSLVSKTVQDSFLHSKCSLPEHRRTCSALQPKKIKEELKEGQKKYCARQEVLWRASSSQSNSTGTPQASPGGSKNGSHTQGPEPLCEETKSVGEEPKSCLEEEQKELGTAEAVAANKLVAELEALSGWSPLPNESGFQVEMPGSNPALPVLCADFTDPTMHLEVLISTIRRRDLEKEKTQSMKVPDLRDYLKLHGVKGRRKKEDMVAAAVYSLCPGLIS